MDYITNEDIEQRLGSDAYVQLTDDDGDGVADTGVVNEARLGAEGEVDSYLARGYAVPVDASGDSELAGLLASVTLDLVELRLRSRRPPVSQEAQQRAQQTIAWLAGVADGRVDLPSVGRISVSPPETLGSTTTGETRILSHDEMSDY